MALSGRPSAVAPGDDPHYLFRAFSMGSADHLHIGNTVAGMAQLVIEKHVSRVREKARVICERIAVERYGAAPRPSVFDGG